MYDEENQSRGHRELLEEFIVAYRNEPCLWQITSKYYHNRNKRDAAYKRLEGIYKIIDAKATKETILKKISNLRSAYKKEVNKMKASEKSGAGADKIYIPKLWYFNLFTFLNEKDTFRNSIIHLNSKEEIPDETDDLLQSNMNREDSQSSMPTRRPKTLTDEVLVTVNEHLESPKTGEDRFDFFTKNIGMKLRELPKEQRIIAEKIINDTLFLAEIGSLTLSHSVKGPEFFNTAYSTQPCMSAQQGHYPHQVNEFQSSTHHPYTITMLSDFSRPSSQNSASSFFSNFSSDDLTVD